MTSHRATGPARGMRGRLLALIAVAVVVAAVIVAVILGFPGGSNDGSGGGSPSATPTSAGTTSGSPSATPSATTSTTPAPPASSSPAAPKGPPKLAASAPKRLVVSGLVDAGFGDSISPSGHYVVQSPTLLLRDGTKGLPGSPGTGTTVVIGASTRSGTGAFDALDQIKKGATVDLQNDAGTLTYKVSSVGGHAPDDVPGMKALTEKATDRLVLVVAHYDNGQRLGDDTVVIAKLTGAHKG